VIALTVVTAILLVLAVDEHAALSPRAAEKIARWSARLRYDDQGRAQDRAEEWSALVGVRPWNVLKLATALSFASAAVRAWAVRAVAGLYAQVPAVTADGRVALKKVAAVAVACAMAFTVLVTVESAVTRVPGIRAGLGGGVQGAVPELSSALLPAAALPGFTALPGFGTIPMAAGGGTDGLLAGCPSAAGGQVAPSAEASEAFGPRSGTGPEITEMLLQYRASTAEGQLTQFADAANACSSFPSTLQSLVLEIGITPEAFPSYGDDTVALRLSADMISDGDLLIDSDIVAVRYAGTLMVLVITNNAGQPDPVLTRTMVRAACMKVAAWEAAARGQAPQASSPQAAPELVALVLVSSVAEAAQRVISEPLTATFNSAATTLEG
jgi:hypothetical protein